MKLLKSLEKMNNHASPFSKNNKLNSNRRRKIKKSLFENITKNPTVLKDSCSYSKNHGKQVHIGKVDNKSSAQNLSVDPQHTYGSVIHNTVNNHRTSATTVETANNPIVTAQNNYPILASSSSQTTTNDSACRTYSQKLRPNLQLPEEQLNAGIVRHNERIQNYPQEMLTNSIQTRSNVLVDPRSLYRNDGLINNPVYRPNQNLAMVKPNVKQTNTSNINNTQDSLIKPNPKTQFRGSSCLLKPSVRRMKQMPSMIGQNLHPYYEQIYNNRNVNHPTELSQIQSSIPLPNLESVHTNAFNNYRDDILQLKQNASYNYSDNRINYIYYIYQNKLKYCSKSELKIKSNETLKDLNESVQEILQTIYDILMAALSYQTPVDWFQCQQIIEIVVQAIKEERNIDTINYCEIFLSAVQEYLEEPLTLEFDPLLISSVMLKLVPILTSLVGSDELLMFSGDLYVNSLVHYMQLYSKGIIHPASYHVASVVDVVINSSLQYIQANTDKPEGHEESIKPIKQTMKNTSMESSAINPCTENDYIEIAMSTIRVPGIELAENGSKGIINNTLTKPKLKGRLMRWKCILQEVVNMPKNELPIFGLAVIRIIDRIKD